MSSANHRAILQEIRHSLFTENGSKKQLLKFHSNHPGANKLTSQTGSFGMLQWGVSLSNNCWGYVRGIGSYIQVSVTHLNIRVSIKLVPDLKMSSSDLKL